MKRVIANLGILFRRRPARTSLSVLPAAVVAASLFTPAARAEDNGGGERNILLIIADDIGVDKIGQPCVAYYNFTSQKHDDITASTVGEPNTPNVAALKKSGVAFLNNWACPTCSPTRATIITGTYPFRHGVSSPDDAEDFSDGIDPGDPNDDPITIATVLKDAGYATALFGKWHLGEEPGHGPIDHGWDKHEGFLGGGLEDYYDWEKVTSDPNGDAYEDPNAYAPLVNVTDAIEWIKGQPSNGRWMATVAFNAAHTVGTTESNQTLKGQAPPTDCVSCYQVKDPNDEEQVYRATVEYMDFLIGELLAGIETDKLKKTTIIFICDNGTDGKRSTHFGRSAAKGTLYEGGVNTLLIIADGNHYLSGQSGTGTGKVVNPNRLSLALVHAVDLFATVAAIADADDSSGVDSLSLIPLIENTMGSVRSAVYTEGSGTDPVDGDWTGWAVRTWQYKLIEKIYAKKTTQELYEVSADRWEKKERLGDGKSFAEKIAVQQLTIAKDLIVGP